MTFPSKVYKLNQMQLILNFKLDNLMYLSINLIIINDKAKITLL